MVATTVAVLFLYVAVTMLALLDQICLITIFRISSMISGPGASPASSVASPPLCPMGAGLYGSANTAGLRSFQRDLMSNGEEACTGLDVNGEVLQSWQVEKDARILRLQVNDDSSAMHLRVCERGRARK
jgi:hypothetical protein